MMRCNAFVQFEIAFLRATYNGHPFFVRGRSLRSLCGEAAVTDRQITPLREVLCTQFTHFAVIRAVITDTLEYLIVINVPSPPPLRYARAAYLPYSAERNRLLVIKRRVIFAYLIANDSTVSYTIGIYRRYLDETRGRKKLQKERERERKIVY